MRRASSSDSGVFGPDAFDLDGLVEPFELAVALGIIGTDPHVGHAAEADELLEVLGDELRPVVGDDAGRGVGEPLAARCRRIRTSRSVIDSRMSHSTRNRLKPSKMLHR